MIYNLEQIMQLRKRKAILKAAKKLGYKDACRAEQFKTLPLTAVFGGVESDLGEFRNNYGTAKFKGSLFTEVEGVEQFEFFVLQTNYYTRKREFKMYCLDIWYKEVEL